MGIAVLLLSPNITVIGGALFAGPFFILMILILGGVLMLIYSICYCCKRRRGRNAMCCRFTTYCQSVLVLMYFLFLALVIFQFVFLYQDRQYYNHSSRQLILMGVVLGVGFLPTTMFLVYYWYSKSCACCRRDKSIVMEE